MAQFEHSVPYLPWGERNLAAATPSLVGTDVKVLQTLYNLFVRYAAPSGATPGLIGEDGRFGPDTRQAVLAWQRHFGLRPDGLVGPETRASFGQSGESYGGPAFGSRAIDTIGESGGDVMVLQNRLNCYRYGSFTGSSATSTFDAGTRDAVRNLERDLAALGLDPGVPIDGLVRAEVLDALWAYTYVGGRTLSVGRHGLDTLWLQRFLKGEGYYADPLDGLFGAATRAAAGDFQATVGTVPDGVVGPLTMYHIGRRVGGRVSEWP